MVLGVLKFYFTALLFFVVILPANFVIPSVLNGFQWPNIIALSMLFFYNKRIALNIGYDKMS